MSRLENLKRLEYKMIKLKQRKENSFFALIQDENGKMILDSDSFGASVFTGEREEKFNKILKEFISGYSNILKEEMFLTQKEFQELDHD